MNAWACRIGVKYALHTLKRLNLTVRMQIRRFTTIDRCILPEDRKSSGCCRSLLLELEFLLDAAHNSMHASDAGGNYGQDLESERVSVLIREGADRLHHRVLARNKRRSVLGQNGFQQYTPPCSCCLCYHDFETDHYRHAEGLLIDVCSYDNGMLRVA